MIPRLSKLIAIASLPFLVTACVKDQCRQSHTYTYYKPVYKTKQEVRNNIKSNPAKEVANPGKLYIKGSYIFLNELEKGIHIIDNSNPSSPRNIAFIDIPGNLDLAVKGNTLYADLYTDLVAIDISNPSTVTVKKVVENIFPYRQYAGGFVYNSNSGIITEWVRVDTTVSNSCDEQWIGNIRSDVFLVSAATGYNGPIRNTASAPAGQGGSMARFTIMNDRLYTVSNSHLDVFNISNSNDPVNTSNVNIGWDIETIFPFKNKLFIGSMTGMYIYDVSNPDAPVRTGQFNHVRTCDPVIADDTHAFVTLRSGTPCMGFQNELDILELNGFNPVLTKVYQMRNPHGLSKDGNWLFVCDGADGLKVYNASDVNNLQLLKQINNLETYDVIAYANRALVVAKDGLYQYDYSDIQNIRLLSKIQVSNQ